MTLAPGDKLSQRARVAYAFTLPGPYRVRCTTIRGTKPGTNALRWYYGYDAARTRRNPDNVWTGTLESNTVEVRVVAAGEVAHGPL